MLPRQQAVGSESCRRREQAALDFRALSGLDRDRGEDQRQRRGVTVFARSGCIVQFLSSRKPVLELHLLMVSESVASYRLVVVLSSASARDFGGVLRAGLRQRRGWMVCSGSAVALGKQSRLQSALLLLVFGYSSGDLQRRGSAGGSKCGIFNWRRQW